MRYLKLTIAYDGTDYVGWQVQPNGISIQQKLETAWQDVTDESIRIVASGRTDAGVHARGQVCSLASESQLENLTLARALNAQLPEDIRVLQIESAANDFHAIRDSISKTYRYQIQLGPLREIFERRYRWHIRRDLDLESLRAAAQLIVGEQDFACFQAAGAVTKTTVRNVTELDILLTGQGSTRFLDIVISADGFLYNMVRNIVGTLVEVGAGKKSPAWVGDVIAGKDRTLAGPTAPALGLFLEHVQYEESSLK